MVGEEKEGNILVFTRMSVIASLKLDWKKSTAKPDIGTQHVLRYNIIVAHVIPSSISNHVNYI